MVSRQGHGLDTGSAFAPLRFRGSSVRWISREGMAEDAEEGDRRNGS